MSSPISRTARGSATDEPLAGRSAAGRTRDLTCFFAFTYGDALPDDDAGREDFFILAHHVARLNDEPASNIIRHCHGALM